MSNIENPLVSIIIPTFKRPVTLKRTILSVINSDYKNVEVIVVDDNNNGDDGRLATEEIMIPLMKEYDCIKYIKHSINKNGSAARNTGIKNSSGEYLMFLDDDDEFLKSKISSQVRFMNSHDEQWGACYTRYIDKLDGKQVSICCETKSGNLLADELARNLFIHAGSNLMVRRYIALEIGGFDESFRRNQDVEFLVRILEKYKLGYVDCMGLIVNVHAKNYGVDYFDLTQQYLDKFRNSIKKLKPEIQRQIYAMIGLQQIRHALEKRNVSRLQSLKRQYKLSYANVLRYMIHLSFRYISKKSYGYNMNNISTKEI